MPVTSTLFPTTPSTLNSSSISMMKHQVRMEIVVKEGTRNLNVGRILREFMIRANEKEMLTFTTLKASHSRLISFPMRMDLRRS